MLKHCSSLNFFKLIPWMVETQAFFTYFGELVVQRVDR